MKKKKLNVKKKPIMAYNNQESNDSFIFKSTKNNERKDYIFFKSGNPLVVPVETDPETDPENDPETKIDS